MALNVGGRDRYISQLLVYQVISPAGFLALGLPDQRLSLSPTNASGDNRNIVFLKLDVHAEA